MNLKHYAAPQPATVATAEELQLQTRPLDVFEIAFLAYRKTHYLELQENPRDEKHAKFIKQQLKQINREQERQYGYTKQLDQ